MRGGCVVSHQTAEEADVESFLVESREGIESELIDWLRTRVYSFDVVQHLSAQVEGFCERGCGGCDGGADACGG